MQDRSEGQVQGVSSLSIYLWSNPIGTSWNSINIHHNPSTIQNPRSTSQHCLFKIFSGYWLFQVLISGHYLRPPQMVPQGFDPASHESLLLSIVVPTGEANM